MATLLRIARRWNLANPRSYSNISILRYSSTLAAATTTAAASSTTAKPLHPKAAQAQVAKLRRGYAMQLKELRKRYMYDMEVQKQEEMRNDDVRREEILRQRKKRNKLKAAYAAARAIKLTAFENELQQTLEIMADKKLVGSEGCSKSQDVAPARAPTRVIYRNLGDEAIKLIFDAYRKVLGDVVPPLYPVFVVFSVSVHLPLDIQGGELSGYIGLRDELGSVVLFQNVYDESIPIRDNELVPLQVPAYSWDRAVSAFRQVEFDLELFIKVEDKEEVLGNVLDSWDFESSLERGRYDRYRTCDIHGDHGSLIVYYAALKCGVQATVEASFQILDDDNDPLQVYGTIVAYYGDSAMECEPSDKKYYQVTLFSRQKGNCKSALQGTGKIPLSRSVVALPSQCSLVIEAYLHNDNGDEILGGTYSFPAKLEDSSDGSIEGKGFNLNLKVEWLCREHD